MHDMTTDEGKRFNRTLAEAKNLDVFSSFYTQTLIDYKWPLVRFYTILMLFVPSVFQLIVFTLYSNLLTGQFDTSNTDYFWSKIAFITALYLLSGYFLSVELRQMKSNGWSYFL